MVGSLLLPSRHPFAKPLTAIKQRAPMPSFRTHAASRPERSRGTQIPDSTALPLFPAVDSVPQATPNDSGSPHILVTARARSDFAGNASASHMNMGYSIRFREKLDDNLPFPLSFRHAIR